MNAKWPFWICRVIVLGWIALSGAPGQSASTTDALSAGFARFDITPDLRLSNWITHQPYGEMLEPVYVRALVLAQGTNRFAWLSWELLYPMEGAVSTVRQRITRETGIPGLHILVTATHNHSAPWSPIFDTPLTHAEQKVLESFLTDPLYPAWTEKLLELSVRAVKQADATRRPATLALGRAYAGDQIFNRRPRKPDGTVQGMATPANPYVLPDGLRFAPVDPTMSVLVLRDAQHQIIGTVFSLPCHAVSIYPTYNGISSDWAGTAATALSQALGGEALFLQGCAGNIVPARRGLAARDEMVKVLVDRAADAAKCAQTLDTQPRLQVAREWVQAPVTETVRHDTGRNHFTAEVQALCWGDLALVTLPGEPMIELALAIQARSPFPHTIIIGYANGYGVQYVGMPGEKALGGYEVGSRNLGTDECGQLLVDAAVRLLEQQAKAKQTTGPTTAPSRASGG